MDRTRLQQLGLTAQQRRPERADLALRQLADGAGVLAQSAERRRLQHRRADAAVPRRFARRAAQHAGRGSGGGAARHRHGATQLLGNLVRGAARRASSRSSSRYNIQPAIDVYVSVQGTDLGERRRAGADSSSTRCAPKLPRGSQIVVRGQVQTMQASFIGLGVGLAMAIVLVYLLIVVNFQSWIDAADHHRRAARGARRHRLDAVHHRHAR